MIFINKKLSYYIINRNFSICQKKILKKIKKKKLVFKTRIKRVDLLFNVVVLALFAIVASTSKRRKQMLQSKLLYSMVGR